VLGMGARVCGGGAGRVLGWGGWGWWVLGLERGGSARRGLDVGMVRVGEVRWEDQLMIAWCVLVRCRLGPRVLNQREVIRG
jgi:hypothetical protein